MSVPRGTWNLGGRGAPAHAGARSRTALDVLDILEYLENMSKRSADETPLYVKLPAATGEKLDRAAAARGLAKKELVAELVERYIDPGVGQPGGGTVGTYSFRAYEPPEIMSAEQAAQFLQLEEGVVLELAEAGQLPGRKLGASWRFARAALVAWLSAPPEALR